MQRVSVIGVSGSGKSTLARSLSAALDLPHTELDAVYHQPGWSHPEIDEFRASVSDVVAGDRWVIDGNYSGVVDLVWARADTIVWLDRPRWVAAGRVLRRTLQRVTLRQELWNGNRERWSNLLRPDPERNVVVWSWTTHPDYVRRYSAVMADPVLDHAERVRLRSDDQVARFLRDAVAQADAVAKGDADDTGGLGS